MLLRLFICTVLLAILGLILEQLLLVLVIASLALLAWHYYQIQKLFRWLWHDLSLNPPQGMGSWGVIFNGIYQRLKKKRYKITQLLELLRQFRRGVEALPDAAVVLNAEHNILWCNKLAGSILGLTLPRDRWQRLDNLIRHPDFIRYLGGADFNEPLELASPITEKHVIEIRLMPYGNNQLLLIARDITRIRQLEKMRKDFVANVSHELKTPLTVLQGYLEMMADAPEIQSQHAKPIAMMEQQTYRMQCVVEQLLMLSHIESAIKAEFKMVDISLMMDWLEDEAQVLSQGRHSICFQVDPKLNVYSNELLMRSACLNLIANAIHYTGSGGDISVCWERISTGVRFSVTDSGVGIAPQHIPRLTERFYRVDADRSRKAGGSGLGLAIVKHALNYHETGLDISSELNSGSTFSFVLPSHLICDVLY